ncbi:MAG: heavy metal translocating P-type ATPase, partial [Candidatus Cloacimonetes bacterium]|nr:heavy metal translocating P-type ATPase [Candidatus Cloacimonadota bacterium]
KKYKVKNLSCASCAAKIEDGVAKLEEVNFISVNFANSFIQVDTNDIEKVKAKIKEIEAEVEIVEDDKEEEEEFDIKMELLKIFFIISILVVGISYKDSLHDTPYEFAEYLVFVTIYLLSGWGVLKTAALNIVKGQVFNEQFLMSVATLGAFAIHEMPEAVAVMVFYNVGEFFQDLAVHRSRKSIKSLLEIRPDHANLLIDEDVKEVSPDDVKVGDRILVKPGEKIPLDGEVLEGSSMLDTSALTGESVPRSVKVNEDVMAGMINKSGTLTIKVTKLFGESSISKILDLVENATSKKAETEKFITKFARYYTPAVVLGAILVAVLPPLLVAEQSFSVWIYRALIMLVVSCPCALVISIPLGYFGGIGGASRRGILVKGSNYLDALTAVKTIVFDKTGTLTKGVFKVSEINTKNGYEESEVLKFAAYAEANSNHPIAQSILEAYKCEIEHAKIGNITEIAGHGIEAEIDAIIVITGNDKLLHIKNIEHDKCDIEGTVVHVAVDSKYAGYIVISDEIKEDAFKAIKELKNYGVKRTVMLTGDNDFAAKSIAGKLNIDEVYAELLPEDKVNYIEKFISESCKGDKVAFVGDGINDAPVLARADIGIAMGALGSDAAIETADVVLMNDTLSSVPTSIKIAKKTRRIVWQNIIFALGVKFLFIIFAAFGLATMWEAVFGDMGVALIAILNATRVLKTD